METNLTVTLKAGTQSNVAQQFKDAAAGAKELNSEADKFWRKMQERAGLQVERERMAMDRQMNPQKRGLLGVMFPGISGAMSPGLTAGAGVAVGAVAAFATAKAGMDALAQAADSAGNTFLSARDRARGMAEAIPIFGSLAKSFNDFMDVVSGVSQRLREGQHDLAVEQGKRGADLGMFSRLQDETAAFNTIGARRDASRLAGPPKGLELPESRKTLQEEITYRQAERMLAPRAQLYRAERDENAAQIELGGAQHQRFSLEMEVQARREARDKALRSVKNSMEDPDTTKDQLAKDWGRLQLTGNEVVAKEAELQKAITREREAQMRVEQARGRVMEANNAKTQAELANVRQLRQESEGRHQSFGSMNRAERTMAFQAMKMLQSRGYDALPQQYRSALSGAGFGDVMGKEAQASAARDPMFQQMLRMQGLSGISDLEKLRKQEAKLAVDVTVQPIINENKLAESIASVMDKAFAKFVDTIKAHVDDKGKQAEIGDRARRAVSGQ